MRFVDTSDFKTQSDKLLFAIKQAECATQNLEDMLNKLCKPEDAKFNYNYRLAQTFLRNYSADLNDAISYHSNTFKELKHSHLKLLRKIDHLEDDLTLFCSRFIPPYADDTLSKAHALNTRTHALLLKKLELCDRFILYCIKERIMFDAYYSMHFLRMKASLSFTNDPIFDDTFNKCISSVRYASTLESQLRLNA